MIWKSLKRDHRNKQQLLRVTNVIAHGAWDQTPQRVRNSKHQWGTRSTLTAAVFPSSIWLHGRGGTNAKVPSCYWPGQPGKGTPHEEGNLLFQNDTSRKPLLGYLRVQGNVFRVHSVIFQTSVVQKFGERSKECARIRTRPSVTCSLNLHLTVSNH